MSRRRVGLVGGALGLSVFGALAHNVMEFGFASLLAAETGTIPMLAVWATLFAVWWRVTRLRVAAAWALVGITVLNLVGGVVISVLPLGLLPFDPEQSFGHYAAHAVYGVTQVPLVAVGLREAMGRGRWVRQAG